MSWLLLALLAPFFYSTCNFLDKYIVRIGVVDYRGMPMYTAVTGFLFGSTWWLLKGCHTMSVKDTILVFMAGLVSALATVLYFKVIYFMTASKVIILMQLVPLMVLLMSSIFLNEELTLKQIVGFFVILTAAFGLTYLTELPTSDKMKLSSAILIITADFLWALSNIFLKIASGNNSVATVFTYQSWGMVIGLLIFSLLLPKVKNSFISSFKNNGLKTFILVFINELLFITGKIVNLAAVSMAPVSLVSVIGNTQIFFGIIIGIFLTLLAPEIFEESISSKGIAIEFFWALIMFLGICLIYR